MSKMTREINNRMDIEDLLHLQSIPGMFVEPEAIKQMEELQSEINKRHLPQPSLDLNLQVLF